MTQIVMLNRYTKYSHITGILLSILIITGCENFLNVDPKSSISDDQTIFDKSSAETALNGVYSSLADANYYGTSFQSIGYLSGDNVQWTGSQSQVQEFINHQVNAENATISSVWVAIYKTINRANHIISKVPLVDDTSLPVSTKNQIIGEAHFVRALAYFDLARTWGGAVIITTPTSSPSENSGIPRSTQTETYAQVIKDLNLAEPLLSETTQRHRATRKTVWALKARYYLYQNNWQKAEEYSTKIIQDNQFKLLLPYNAFFANNARGTEESILELYYNGTSEINNHRGQWQPQINGGTRQWAPNEALIKLLNTNETGGNRKSLIAVDNQNRWYGNLYYRAPASDPTYILRIAELYLIRAEARAHLGNIQGGLEDLNAVRQRAGLEPSTTTSSDQLLLLVENERRLEFALEPHRWFDLVRTDRAAEVLSIQDKRRYLLPVPSAQLLADKALIQNEGY